MPHYQIKTNTAEINNQSEFLIYQIVHSLVDKALYGIATVFGNVGPKALCDMNCFNWLENITSEKREKQKKGKKEREKERKGEKEKELPDGTSTEQRGILISLNVFKTSSNGARTLPLKLNPKIASTTSL